MNGRRLIRTWSTVMGLAFVLAAPAQAAPALRPALFGALPAWLTGSAVGLTRPNDLSDAGQKLVDATVFPGLKTFANAGRARQVVVTSLPFTATAGETEYILLNDLATTGAGIIITGGLANWTVNLNGHTLTFGTGTPTTNQVDCFGVGSLYADRYGISGGQLVNGRIVYGGGPGTNGRGNYGEGYNPVMFHSGGVAYIGGLYLVGSADQSSLISGMYLGNSRIEYNTFDDQSATITDRMAPPCQIRCSGGNVIRWNRVLHARQFGFQIGSGTLVECNEIYLDGLDTNSQCIGGYGIENGVVRCNNLYGTGAMPTGLGLGGGAGASNWQVYSNWFEGLFTRQALRTAGDLDDYQNHAVGLSMRWGTHTGNRICNNTLICYARSQSVVGSAGTWDATGKAVFYNNGTATTDNLFASNVFAAVSLDGVARSMHDDYTPVPALGAMTAIAVGPSGTIAGGVTFAGNRIVSDICPLGLPDAYSGVLGPNAAGVRMLFDGNIIERVGAVPGFALISYGGHGGAQCAVDFIGNAYVNTTENTLWDIDSANAPGTGISYRYGYWLTVACTTGGVAVAGAAVTVTDATGALLDAQVTDVSGMCRVRGLTRRHTATADTVLTPLTISATWAALAGSLAATPTATSTYAVSLSASPGGGDTAIPVFTNTAAGNVGTNALTLSASVTGAPPITVYAFWGPVDGGTNAANWANPTHVGVIAPGSSFAVNLTGLPAHTACYYRFMGSNSAGIGWSPAGTTFRTLGGAALVWTNKATTGSWGTNAVWDTYPAQPAFDGTEDAVLGAATVASSTYSLNGNRFVNSVSVAGTQKIIISAGANPASRLILRSGRLTRTQTAQYLEISAAVQIDDGVVPAAGVWNCGPSGAGVFTLYAPLYGLPQSSIQKTNVVTLSLQADSSASFAGTWFVDAGGVQLVHSNGFGSGTVKVRNGGNINPGGTLTLTNSLEFANGDAGFSTPNQTTFTLAGPISGPGRLFPNGSSSSQTGAIRLSSTNITATGGIDFNRCCPIIMSGIWTNCGSVVLRTANGPTSLQGNGVLGMAASKTLTMVQTAAAYTNYIAPGDGTPVWAPTNGSIGTLTIGTPGNNNSVTFDRGSRYVVDLTPTSSDKLVVFGKVFLSGAGITNQLSLYGTLGAATTYTLMEYTAWNTGRFFYVYLNNALLAAPTNALGVNGTHTLVYGATSLQLVGMPGGGGALMILR